jgi:hypothetical protein
MAEQSWRTRPCGRRCRTVKRVYVQSWRSVGAAAGDLA